MKDLKARLDKLEVDAAESELIANLATDPGKSQVFESLAIQYRAMAQQVKAQMARMEKRA